MPHSIAFQITVKTVARSELARSRVARLRPRRPATPSAATTWRTAAAYARRRVGRLPDRLDDAHRVRDHVGDARRREAEAGGAEEARQQHAARRRRQRLVQRVEREPPRVVADEVRDAVGDRASPQHARALGARLRDEQRVRAVAVDLQRRLEHVERRDRQPPPRRRRRRHRGAHAHRQPRVRRREQREHARVGGGVAEARERRLQQREADAAVEARDAALGVEHAQRLAHPRAVAVLVVHRRAQPHQQRHLHDARHRGLRDRRRGRAAPPSPGWRRRSPRRRSPPRPTTTTTEAGREDEQHQRLGQHPERAARAPPARRRRARGDRARGDRLPSDSDGSETSASSSSPRLPRRLARIALLGCARVARSHAAAEAAASPPRRRRRTPTPRDRAARRHMLRRVRRFQSARGLAVGTELTRRSVAAVDAELGRLYAGGADIHEIPAAEVVEIDASGGHDAYGELTEKGVRAVLKLLAPRPATFSSTSAAAPAACASRSRSETARNRVQPRRRAVGVAPRRGPGGAGARRRGDGAARAASAGRYH